MLAAPSTAAALPDTLDQQYHHPAAPFDTASLSSAMSSPYLGAAAPSAVALPPLANGSSGSAAHPPPPSEPLLPVMDHVYTHGLVGGQFADTVLCVAAPSFAKVYPVHALLLSRVPAFRDRLLALRSSGLMLPSPAAMPPLPPLGVTSPTHVVMLPDDAALAGLGFVRGRDYLWRIDVVLPAPASDDAMGMVLSHMYSMALPPPSMAPELAVAVLTVASALGIAPLVDHVAMHVQASLSLDTLPAYLPLLASPLAHLVTAFLGSLLAALPPNPAAADYARVVKAYAQLPWALLKMLLETPHHQLPQAGAAAGHLTPLIEHGRFDFAKRVLVARGRPDESVCYAFENGGSNVKLTRLADRKAKKKMWKIDG
ncbi:hypothetical protein H9P43_002994 [Blastocladiella emersonii ATCC 22665]|nr:hypothetical protein H9P43_002994 [Blastocladiella emersonii ATCC 22665]